MKCFSIVEFGNAYSGSYTDRLLEANQRTAIAEQKERTMNERHIDLVREVCLRLRRHHSWCE